MAATAISVARRRALTVALRALGGPSPKKYPCFAPRVFHGFCTSQSINDQPSESPDRPPHPSAGGATELASPREDEKGRPRRRPTESSAPLHETICYMMAKRPWTTRLQNSIRSLCSSFDQELVLAVVRGAREPDHALRFFRWVEKTGFRHDTATYGEIVRLLTRHRMLNHARGLILDDMPKRGLQPDERMLAALIEGYGLAGIPQEAVKIFRRMPELGVERGVRSYDAFFKAILRSGRAMMAKRVFNQMLREGVEPTLFTFNNLIWGFCLCQRMSTAARFLAEMKERSILPDVVTYNTFVGGLRRPRPNSITYALLIKGYASSGKVGEALRFFAQMVEKGIKPTEQTYSALLPGLCGDMERLGEAKKLLGEMTERHIGLRDGSVFLNLISGLCGAGRLDEALQVLPMMEGLKARADLSHYNFLLENLCRESRYDRAVEMVDEVVEKGVLLDPRSSSSEMSPGAYNPVIEYMCRNGLTKKAEALFRQLMKKGADDPVAFDNLIRGHAREGTPESAADILAIVNRRGVTTESDAYAMLVESFLGKGDPAVAKATLDSMIEQGHLPSPSLFRSVMEALFEDGRVQTASRLMRSMIEKGVRENLDGHVEEALGRINLLWVNECAPDVDRLLLVLCDKGKTIAALKLAEFGLEAECEIDFSTYDRGYTLLCKIKKKGGATNQKGCQALIKSLIAEGKTEQADTLYRLVFGHARGKRSGASAEGEEAA
ncbi:unnamed protein product [Spirodela intermedia]|uniref:Pentatricopeptide repeat-containing protein-mitochondrial domain-containing protein n=1 Tax=Spirodela intermedia TaxID=51605 RepID=A0A7I8J8Q5_SPIIN|nr:unnamed protein product [Spirodela intermedia]CAA6666440.1 unnamed protein product [Spirodela intermedia]